MQNIHEEVYSQIIKVLQKNIDAQKAYLKAAQIAKQHDVKLFFNHKATDSGLFNDKLIFELNYAFDFPKIEKCFTENLPSNWMDTEFLSDESMLVKTFTHDHTLLKDYEALLTYSKLPVAIRFIMKEQVTVIKLDRHKIEQLITIYK